MKCEFDCSDWMFPWAENVEIPVLKQKLGISIDKDHKKYQDFSPKQKRCFENFLKIDQAEIDKMYIALEQYLSELIQKDQIVKSTLKQKNRFDLDYDFILLPYQNETKDEYLFLISNTFWKIKYSQNYIELEILFKNNQFYLLQEMTGLWARIEWGDQYNCQNSS